MNNVKIIISRYNESLNWLEESPFNEFQYVVYNKGDNDDFNKTNVTDVIQLPNVGKCDHTYLYHIVHNFDNLNNILVFFPGSLEINGKKSKAIDMLERIKKNNCEKAIFIGDYSRNILREFGSFTLDSWTTSFLQNYEKNNESALYPTNIRPFGKWYLHNFGNININYYTLQGIFSVDKKDILQHPKYRYEKLLQQVEIHSNPEVGHYIERSWGTIFYPMKNTRVAINNIPRQRPIIKFRVNKIQQFKKIQMKQNRFNKFNRMNK
jgi:hypothetical protein